MLKAFASLDDLLGIDLPHKFCPIILIKISLKNNAGIEWIVIGVSHFHGRFISGSDGICLRVARIVLWSGSAVGLSIHSFVLWKSLRSDHDRFLLSISF